jgi:hypothetical protein
MALSSPSQVVIEGTPLEVGAFNRNGVLNILWFAQSGMKTQLWWKPHTSGNFTEVPGQVFASMKNIKAIYLSPNDSLLVFWDDGVSVYQASMAYSTGAVITPQTKVATGIKPVAVWRGGVVGSDLILAYLIPNKSIYIRESRDGGATWGGERPVLTNRITGTSDLIVFPFDDEHISVMQMGSPSRPLVELGSWLHTRPISHLAAHPSDSTKIFAAEPNGAEGDLNSNLFGALMTSRDGSTLFTFGGYRLGVDDGVGQISKLDVTGVPVSVSSSASPSSANGDDLVVMTLTPGVTGVYDLWGSGVGDYSKVVGADCTSSYLYVCGRSDIAHPTTGGIFGVVNPSGYASTTVVSGIAACHAVAAGIPPSGTPIILLATLEGSQEYLSIYLENGTSPALQGKHKLPAAVNSITVVMTSTTQGTIYISMVDRLNIFKLNGLTSPIRMLLSIPALTLGNFFRSKIASNGNIIVAMGNAGVGVFNQYGEMLSQVLPSEIITPEWTAKTFALNDLVRPTLNNFFRPQRLYFKCTTGGASGSVEPKWAATGTVSDGNAVWTPQGSTDTYTTSVLLDVARKRIYAAGVLGGVQGTSGRIYTISAPALLGS